MPKHDSVLLYVHRNRKARKDGKPRAATSTFTQLLNSEAKHTSMDLHIYVHDQSYIADLLQESVGNIPGSKRSMPGYTADLLQESEGNIPGNK